MAEDRISAAPGSQPSGDAAPQLRLNYRERAGRPMSGARYRFDGPGAKAQIDMRDAPSMAAVPNVRRLT